MSHEYWQGFAHGAIAVLLWWAVLATWGAIAVHRARRRRNHTAAPHIYKHGPDTTACTVCQLPFDKCTGLKPGRGRGV